MDRGSRKTEATGMERGGGKGVQTLKIPHPNQALLSFASILGEYSTVHSPPAIFFFNTEISSLTLIPPFRLGSVHSSLTLIPPFRLGSVHSGKTS